MGPKNYLVEEHKRDVELLLVKHLEPGLDVAAEFLAVNRQVVARQPVGVQDGTLESLLPVNAREVLVGDEVNVLVRPPSLVVFHEAVLEQAECFVGPQPDQPFHVQRLQRTVITKP